MFKKLLGLDSSQEIDQWELAFRGGPFLGILLIVAAIAFAIFLYRREQLVTRNRRITMIALQAAVLLLLILVLMQPYAKIRTSNESKRSMIVMLDTSRSMAIQDPRTAASDVEEAAKALGKPKRQSKFSDGPAPKRPRGDPDATDSDDDDEEDDTCACCGRSTLTAAGLAMKEVLICDNRECRAECHL